jgi:DNA-binding NarL/FixJ family response regulator
VNQIQILVADDHEFVRRAICGVLRTEPDFRILCEVKDGAEAIRKSKEMQPDVVVLDVSMPEPGGFEAARQILAVAPKTEIILLTEHAVTEMARAALKSGIRGYVVKSNAAKDLVNAVRAVIRHEQYVSPTLEVTRTSSYGKASTT